MDLKTKQIKNKTKTFLFLSLTLSLFLLSGCGSQAAKGEKMTAIQLFDRNGVQETISNKERTKIYGQTNFLVAQPYQKIVRTFEKRKDGSSLAKITTYHDNGQVWQYLETVNGRACGEYIEWYPNGVKRMQTNVIEGVGDLTLNAQSTWVFDGVSHVWDDQGQLSAEINYKKGMLEDRSVYYHSNGAISKIIPYKNNQIDGIIQVYDNEGELIGRTEYNQGKRDGNSDFKGNESIPKREELFKNGELVKGKYWDFQGNLLSEIEEGKGVRPIFENGVLIEEREYVRGLPEGQVKIYRENGTLESMYHVFEGKKQGEEWCYYDSNEKSETLQPMLHLNWQDDEIHGTVRTWYENGILESEKEISNNKKNGVFLAWYKDGSLMMVEEYENDRLISGKYLKKGDDLPVSNVISGSGIATIYDSEGKFLRKIEYAEGTPSQ